MVDFKKKLKELRASYTPEQLARVELYEKLEKENTFYVTKTILDDDYSLVSGRGPRHCIEQEVRLYKQIIRGEELTVRDVILISFGGYSEFQFDKYFVERILEQLRDPNRRFCIDGGRELYVTNSDMILIITEALSSLTDRGIELIDDYSKVRPREE